MAAYSLRSLFGRGNPGEVKPSAETPSELPLAETPPASTPAETPKETPAETPQTRTAVTLPPQYGAAVGALATRHERHSSGDGVPYDEGKSGPMTVRHIYDAAPDGATRSLPDLHGLGSLADRVAGFAAGGVVSGDRALKTADNAVKMMADVAIAYAPKPNIFRDGGNRSGSGAPVITLPPDGSIPEGFEVVGGFGASGNETGQDRRRRWLRFAAAASALALAGVFGWIGSSSREKSSDGSNEAVPSMNASIGLKGIDTSGAVQPVKDMQIGDFKGEVSGLFTFDFAPGKPGKGFDGLHTKIADEDREGLVATMPLAVKLSATTVKDEKGGVAGITTEKGPDGKTTSTTVDLSKVQITPIVDIAAMPKGAKLPPICADEMNWPATITEPLAASGIMPGATDPAILAYATQGGTTADMYKKFVVATCTKEQLNILNGLGAAGLHTLFDPKENGSNISQKVKDTLKGAYGFNDRSKWGTVTFTKAGVEAFLKDNAQKIPDDFKKSQEVKQDVARPITNGGVARATYTIDGLGTGKDKS